MILEENPPSFSKQLYQRSTAERRNEHSRNDFRKRKIKCLPSGRSLLEGSENNWSFITDEHRIFNCKYATVISAIAPSAEIPTFFARAQDLARAGFSDSALDAIYDGMQALMNDGDLTAIDMLFEQAEPDKHDIDVCIALLSSTLPVNTVTPSRHLLYKKLRDKLLSMGESAKDVLVGLD